MTPEQLEHLCTLDASGFLLAPGEAPADFLTRVQTIQRAHADFASTLETEGKAPIFDLPPVRKEQRIPAEILTEASAITDKLYRFSVSHVPGFFLTKAVGWLWGGCMLGDPDTGLSVFLLRDGFRKKRRFLHYSREELLSHELCHIARQPLSETTLEEYFAYQTSRSFFRRTLGNCFIRDRDALLFLLPMLLLPVACFLQVFRFPALPLWPFWLLALIYPAFLLLRNARSLHIVRRAEKALRRCRVSEPDPILFRCTLAELKQMPVTAATEESWRKNVEALARQEARWAVIQKRFVITPASAGGQGE